jgi:hypothetical protein
MFFALFVILRGSRGNELLKELLFKISQTDLAVESFSSQGMVA